MNAKTLRLTATLLACLITACSIAQTKLYIQTNGSGETYTFAKTELTRFLTSYYTIVPTPAAARIIISLDTDTSLPEFSFRIGNTPQSPFATGARTSQTSPGTPITQSGRSQPAGKRAVAKAVQSIPGNQTAAGTSGQNTLSSQPAGIRTTSRTHTPKPNQPGQPAPLNAALQHGRPDKPNPSPQTTILLSGHNEAGTLHALYTLLESAGFRFEVTGPIIPTKCNLEVAAKRTTTTIHPAVRSRGIRQHINFPMDMSSYPIEEAKEYIRNLARLRFNYIAFHSYPGQWYEVHRKDSTEYAGNFFYGQQYTIPEKNTNTTLKKIRNNSIYCIPAIESKYYDTAARSKFAIEWLREVMKECKRTGLNIRFSFEARSASTDVSKTVETAKAILDTYPLINELEIICEETGGWEPPASRQNTEAMLIRHFGNDILKEGMVMAPVKDGQPGLDYLFGQIGHNIAAYKLIKDSLLTPRKIKGSIGLYITIPDYLKATFYLLRKYAPDADYSVMPAHGARKTAVQLPFMQLTRQDWDHSMAYSWIEFDGLMYLQQNEIRGIRRLLEYAEDVNGPGSQLNAMCFNHWRLAENRVTTRYAALATLYGPAKVDETTFYTDYAKGLGIKETLLFTQAMRQIDDATWYATTDLPNVGFCFAGTWGKGFGTFGRMNRIKLPKARAMYERASALIQQCAKHVTDTAGRNMLAFLDNRLRATIVYLKGYEKATGLQRFVRQQSFSVGDRKDIAEICNQSLLLFNQYMDLHASMMPDRGCEGTLISVFHTPVAILQRIRFEYAGIPYTDKPAADTKVDAPPPPISFQ